MYCIAGVIDIAISMKKNLVSRKLSVIESQPGNQSVSGGLRETF